VAQAVRLHGVTCERRCVHTGVGERAQVAPVPFDAAGDQRDRDLDVANEAFPFMTWRDTSLDGVPVRVARVSFSGELAFE